MDTMKRKQWLVALWMIFASSPLLLQCNSPVSLCSQYYQLLDTKTGGCTIPGGDQSSVSDKINECADRVAQCNSDDRKAIAASLDCLKKLEVCQLLSVASWLIQASACTNLARELSQTCRSAFVSSGS